MKRTLTLAFVAVSTTLSLAALEWSLYAQTTNAVKPPANPSLPPGTPAEQVETLSKHYQAAMAPLANLAESANSIEDFMKLKELVPDPNRYATLFMQIAEQNPKDPAAVDALTWIVRNSEGRTGKTDPFYAKARKALVGDYLKSPNIGSFCRFLCNDGMDLDAEPVLRNVMAENPDKQVQASAVFALAKLLRHRITFVKILQHGDEKRLAEYAKSYGDDVVADLKRMDAAELRKESEALFEQLINDKVYAASEIVHFDGTKFAVGEVADRELFEWRNLVPGKPAPEILGEDLDGQPMNLSDFRGKVVLLVFSGNWCGPCRGMYPEARDLMEKYKDRPFTIVGVCCESDRDNAKDVRTKEKLAWRSFWDHRPFTGPIQRAWNISGVPTMYLLDHEGVIVNTIGMREQDKDLIEQKVKAAESATSQK